LEEDPTLRFGRDQQTHEMLLSGMGQLHIETIVARLKKRFGVEVTLKPPKVPYRETIRGRADVQGRHKKQSGGHGQYGDCKIKMEPLPRGGQFEFVNEIFGGAIPKNFIPAVEKGILESATRGYLAGYPVVDFRVILYDGSYHDVDSSEMAFKIAGSLAESHGIYQSSLIEPIMNVGVYADAYAGDLMGTNGCGQNTGNGFKAGNQVIKAQVPMSEMLSCAPVTSMTQAVLTTPWVSHYSRSQPDCRTRSFPGQGCQVRQRPRVTGVWCTNCRPADQLTGLRCSTSPLGGGRSAG
jgi:elongation factor G